MNQPIYVSVDGVATFKDTSEVKIGDSLIVINDNGDVSTVDVASIQVSETESKVYDIRAQKYPWFIAGNHIVIS